ncbi:MAG: hypothetical protein IT445_10775 [Phycisphaeraceae bacterium]|nr:hypothetical protein [Phycisphaeraceae bacterium]
MTHTTLGVLIIFAAAVGPAQATLTQDFEGATQGALTSGAVFGDFDVMFNAPGSASIVASPFLNGGANAFQYAGETGGDVTLENSVNADITGDFVVEFDLVLSRAHTAGVGSAFLKLFGTMPDDSVAEMVRLYYKMNNAATQTWLVAYDGIATYTDYTFLQLSSNAHIKISSDLASSTYDVSVTLDDDTILTSYTGQNFWTGSAGAVGLNGIYIGDLHGSNMDGIVDNLVLTSALHPGDANNDGQVNLSDLQILGDNWQSTSATWTQADFTGDSVVNLADLQILGDNWGWGAGSDLAFDEAVETVEAAIPEPTSVVVFGLASLGFMRLNRNRFHKLDPDFQCC